MKYYKIINNIKNVICSNKHFAFSNIAEGTHAGSITIKSAEDIDTSHLLVSLDDSGEAVVICSGNTQPIGVAIDECDINENVSVALAGSAESTFLCRTISDINAGDILYTASGGKVTNKIQGTSFKVGIALNNASIDEIVEVDTQGFGSRAMQFCNAGIHTWTTSQTEETVEVENVSDTDIVIATFQNVGGNEKIIVAKANNGEIKFTLDSSGTPNQTKISWATISNN